MNKCDLCPDSELIHGKLVCPYEACMLTKSEWEKILAVLEKQK